MSLHALLKTELEKNGESLDHIEWQTPSEMDMSYWCATKKFLYYFEEISNGFRFYPVCRSEKRKNIDSHLPKENRLYHGFI